MFVSSVLSAHSSFCSTLIIILIWTSHRQYPLACDQMPKNEAFPEYRNQLNWRRRLRGSPLELSFLISLDFSTMAQRVYFIDMGLFSEPIPGSVRTPKFHTDRSCISSISCLKIEFSFAKIFVPMIVTIYRRVCTSQKNPISDCSIIREPYTFLFYTAAQIYNSPLLQVVHVSRQGMRVSHSRHFTSSSTRIQSNIEGQVVFWRQISLVSIFIDSRLLNPKVTCSTMFTHFYLVEIYRKFPKSPILFFYHQFHPDSQNLSGLLCFLFVDKEYSSFTRTILQDHDGPVQRKSE